MIFQSQLDKGLPECAQNVSSYHTLIIIFLLPSLFRDDSLVHCSCLLELLHCVWTSHPSTLHTARQDLELTGVLRRTVENATTAVLHVSCVCCCSLTPSLSLSQFLVTLSDIEINSNTAQ